MAGDRGTASRAESGDAAREPGGRRPVRRTEPRAARLGRLALKIACRRELTLGRPSDRTAAVASQFGLPTFEPVLNVLEPIELDLEPGRIIAVVGPSGSGKSTLLDRVAQACSGACVVNRVTFPQEAALVDRIAPWAPLAEGLALLSACALGEPRLWLRRFAELSDGERFRARLARALGLVLRQSSASVYGWHGEAQRGRGGRPEDQSPSPHGPSAPDRATRRPTRPTTRSATQEAAASGAPVSGGCTVAPLICDEFCSMLHRRAARAIAFNLQKLARRRNLTAILAFSNEDLLEDLQPDTVVRLLGAGRYRLEPGEPNLKAKPTVRRGLRVEPGSKRDYQDFAAMHYRASDELGFVDKVFVLRERTGGETVGIVVYSYSPLELALRNQATAGKFIRRPRRLNRSMRILRRLVIHPDVRGCGLGHYLVRRTLLRVGTPYVECLAAMGEVNPVFEKAGMKRIGQCSVPRHCQAALEALRALDVDPHGRDFPLQVSRRPRVRAIVARLVYDWYSATTGGGERRVARQAAALIAQTFRGLVGHRPVYYLWQRPRAA